MPYGGAFSMNSPGFELSSSALHLYPDEAEGIRFTRTDGALFTLLSLDMSFIHPDAIFVSPTGVAVTYTGFDVFQTFQATGGYTFPFGGPAWQNVPYFDILHGGHFTDAPTVIDNVRLQSVPGPPTILLIGVGIVGLVVVRGYRVTSNLPNGVSKMWQSHASGARQ